MLRKSLSNLAMLLTAVICSCFVMGTLQTKAGTPAAQPECGDVNNDGVFDISDPITMLSYLYAGGPSPVCAQPQGFLTQEELASYLPRQKYFNIRPEDLPYEVPAGQTLVAVGKVGPGSTFRFSEPGNPTIYTAPSTFNDLDWGFALSEGFSLHPAGGLNSTASVVCFLTNNLGPVQRVTIIDDWIIGDFGAIDGSFTVPAGKKALLKRATANTANGPAPDLFVNGDPLSFGNPQAAGTGGPNGFHVFEAGTLIEWNASSGLVSYQKHFVSFELYDAP